MIDTRPPAKLRTDYKWAKIIAGFFIVLALVLTSCGTAAPTPATPTTPAAPVTPNAPAAPVEEKAQQKAVTAPSQTPKHGGTFTYQSGDPTGFDVVFSQRTQTAHLTNSLLLGGDWAKGPAGTGETNWEFGIVGQVSLYSGDLAERWESPQPDTIIFHLRKGVRWQNKPPVNGREFTADDVVYTLNRIYIQDREFVVNGAYTDDNALARSIKALDKYTVEIKIVPERFGNMLNWMGSWTFILPHEVYEKYGDMKDWRHALGTGPFMLTDYVPGSSTTFVKNPDYFENDALHPENQLPYLDSVRWLNIPDKSTEQAAFRTGKLDRITGVSWEDQALFLQQRPQLKYKEKLNSAQMPGGRQDKKELPFKDIRVRQALNMAVDKQRILDHYYGGRGVLFAQPVPPTPEHSKLFTPLEEQPKAVQELFTYNPDKARQLLKEAGYPDGFKTEIITTADNIDFLAIVRDDLLKVGVDMIIKPLERGAYNNQWKNLTFNEMMTVGAYQWNYANSMATFVPGSDNPTFFNWDRSHERVNEAYKIVPANVGINEALWQKTLKELYPYILEQASMIWMPAYYSYTMWWPWVGNYHGELNVGYSVPSRFLQYIWIDGDLKKAMGY
ncbi:MAG: ABC transporter substrate-binding protein [Chloroflexi bacterium]|nr:ABC transporter substrate-binding protein [Chloroflexota bacterium]